MNYETFESFSTYGEDALLNGVMKRLSWIMQKNLFEHNTYIDVGSFHPVKESNTYFLYKLGWGGTLVDPNSYFNALVHEYRPHDIMLNYAVDVEPGIRELLMFGSLDSSNTLSKEFAERKSASQHSDVSWTATVEAKTITEIIDMHIKHFNKTPFLLNIDIEGLDLDVIKTYPKNIRIPFILIEDDILGSFTNSEINKVMRSMNYAPIASTFLTTLYLDKGSKYYANIKKIGMFEELNG